MSYEVRHGSYDAVLSDIEADLVFTSPPYNLGSQAPKKLGTRSVGGYDPKSYCMQGYPDALPWAEYMEGQRRLVKWVSQHLTASGCFVYNHKPLHKDRRVIQPLSWLLPAADDCGLELKQEIVWARGSSHNNGLTFLQPTTERLWVFARRGEKYSFDKHALPQQYRKDIWMIPLGKSNGHACPFPTLLPELVVRGWSTSGGLVCDPYAGSGSTGVAAVKLGRSFVGSDREKKYVNLCMTNLENA